jgi:Ca2+-binding EF-hand superfamily protein
MIASIPKYRENEIKKLYNATKQTLGSETNQRKRRFMSTLRIYFPWENTETIQQMFNIIKPQEIEYMIKFRSKKLKLEYGKMVRELFGTIDANDDGTIDLDEFKYALRKVETIDSDELFLKADTNNDGVLDTNEFYRLVASTPELRNNFDAIMESALNENYRKTMDQQLRIFKTDVTGRRPSLSDLRKPDDICSFDVPLYNISLPAVVPAIIRRRYGLS